MGRPCQACHTDLCNGDSRGINIGDGAYGGSDGGFGHGAYGESGQQGYGGGTGNNGAYGDSGQQMYGGGSGGHGNNGQGQAPWIGQGAQPNSDRSPSHIGGGARPNSAVSHTASKDFYGLAITAVAIWQAVRG